MSANSTTKSRGMLVVGQSSAASDGASTVDMLPEGVRPYGINLDNDAVDNALSLDDRFQDQGEIAKGGMGSIHRVLELTLNRTVAMKLLPAGEAHKTSVRQRFLTEAQVTGQLQHPNIVPVYEIGSDDEGKLFFTMRLVPGRTLAQFLKDEEDGSDEMVPARSRRCKKASGGVAVPRRGFTSPK